MQITELLENIRTLARECGTMILDRSSLMEVDEKGTDSNLVTNMDVRVQGHIAKRALSLLPGSRIVGEEGAHDEKDRERTDGDPGSAYTWVIDPIDGTSNYVRDIGCSVVSIGLFKTARHTPASFITLTRMKCFPVQSDTEPF